MRPLPLLLLAASATVALLGCAPRVHAFTYTKARVVETDLNRDVENLAGVSGVTKVIPRLDGQGNATLEVYVEDGNQLPGQERATDLGYRRVRY